MSERDTAKAGNAVKPLRFGAFVLDRADRTLRRDGEPIELGSRYFDALVLLAENAGRLVSKDRFMAEVWRGVPVTDEALTQCIRTLRRALGDDASAPRFVETVPKHGYRFVAEVDGGAVPGDDSPSLPKSENVWVRAGRLAGGATLGGALAGGIGGLCYGAIAGAAAQQAGTGAASVLLVMLALNLAIGTLGGAGVGTGMAVACALAGVRPAALIGGGGLGGLGIGALGKLLSLDGFVLLTGLSPGNVTGMSEGLVLGAAIGGAAIIALLRPAMSWRWALTSAAMLGAASGTAIALLGGRLMAGSLALLHGRFPDSQLHVGAVGSVFGEEGLGPLALLATAAFEAGLFAACIAAVLAWLRPRIV